MRHVLVTNDFPPKIGGIQSYLWELWRRLPPDEVTVLTTPHEGAEEFDSQQAFRVVRTRQKWLLPTGRLVRQINALATKVHAGLVVLDPGIPLGILGRRLNLPYVIIGHGAEFTIPARIPFTRPMVNRVVRGSAGVIAGGAWVEAAMVSVIAGRSIRSISVPPGVDTTRFCVLDANEKRAARARFSLPAGVPLIVGVSRLVPRKGFDRLVEASLKVAKHHPDVHVAIAGKGRELARLQRLIEKSGAPVTMLGRVGDSLLPLLYASADVFAMPCHDRWLGLESEGFGIVFVEAAAAGVPSVGGLSGGSAEAVLNGETGFVVAPPVKVDALAKSLITLLDDSRLRARMGHQGRRRAVEEFSYDVLAERLKTFLNQVPIRPPG